MPRRCSHAFLRKPYCKTPDGPAFPTARWEEFCQKVRSVSRKITTLDQQSARLGCTCSHGHDMEERCGISSLPCIDHILFQLYLYKRAAASRRSQHTLRAFLLVKTRSGEKNGRHRISKMHVFGSYRLLLLLGGFASAQPAARE